MFKSTRREPKHVYAWRANQIATLKVLKLVASKVSLKYQMLCRALQKLRIF